MQFQQNRYLLFVFFILLSISQFAQNNLKTYNKFNAVIIEIPYLHIDRNLYASEDTIWYKAYLLDDQNYTLSNISNNLYVELIAPDGSIADKNINYIETRTGQGYFLLSDSIKTGQYTIRAYTNYMRNFGDLLFFKQKISIRNLSTLNTTDKLNTLKNSIDLQFMPEGGNLIENLNSKVAFKAIDLNGKGIDFKGELYDNKHQLVSKISCMHNGMGFFQLKPESGRSYYLKIIEPSCVKTFKLPVAQKEGTALSLNYIGTDYVEIYLVTPPQFINNQQLAVLIHNKGRLVCKKSININSPFKKLKIPKNQLPSGISCITLTDTNNIPIAERLIYNNKDQEFQVKILTDKETYFPREKITLDIKTVDNKGLPIETNLSLSVCNSVGFTKDYSNTPDIYSYFFLTSNFRGKIENPSYYFTDQDNTKLLHLDLVLMTHGWRNFIWKEIAVKEEMPFEIENGFTIKGSVKKQLSKEPYSNTKISLVSLDEGFFYQETQTDSLGNFNFENLFLKDTTNLIIEAYNKNDKRNTRIIIHEQANRPPSFLVQNKKNYSDKITDESDEFELLAEELKLYKQQISRHILLDEVVVKESKKENDGHHRIYLNASKVVELKDHNIAHYTSLLEALRMLAPTVTIRGSIGEYSIYFRRSSSIFGAVPALVLIDGAPSDANMISNLPPELFDKIDILRPTEATIFGARGIGGVIAFHTKKIVEKNEDYEVGIRRLKPKGYQRIRQFYSPNYENKDEKLNYKDLRITAYWNPEIKTDSLGKAKVTFYAPDNNAVYQNIIQGISLDGKLGFSETEIRVKEN